MEKLLLCGFFQVCTEVPNSEGFPVGDEGSSSSIGMIISTTSKGPVVVCLRDFVS